MSGIIPLSTVAYEYLVDGNAKYVTVSFPFRVKIHQIWFTTDNSSFWSGLDGDPYLNDRTLRLAGWITKNTKTQHNPYDSPTDSSFFFGCDPEKPFLAVDETLKPTMWFGNPDNRPVGQIIQVVNNLLGNGHAYRSTSGQAPGLNDPANVGWSNPNWSEAEFAANGYKTDMSVMDVDCMLSLFPYQIGDWTGYNNEGSITIHVAYSGMWDETKMSTTIKPFTPWWED